MATLISETKQTYYLKDICRSSTDSSKEYYLENENPEAYNIVLPKQVYTQGDEILHSPADLISFSSGTDYASNDVGSCVENIINITIIKKYIQIELQEIPSSMVKLPSSITYGCISICWTPTAGMIIMDKHQELEEK